MIVAKVIIMVLFTGLGLTFYTEGVRTVQILGLFGSGMAVGATLVSLIYSITTKQKTE